MIVNELVAVLIFFGNEKVINLIQQRIFDNLTKTSSKYLCIVLVHPCGLTKALFFSNFRWFCFKETNAG